MISQLNGYKIKNKASMLPNNLMQTNQTTIIDCYSFPISSICVCSNNEATIHELADANITKKRQA